jgi:transglutaminase-like putative cysteine protease
MRIEIDHRLQYEYSGAVFCEPLTVRLRPRSDVLTRLEFYDLAIEPVPAGRSEVLDLEGNSICRVWFQDQLSTLSLHVRAIVETLQTNPFEFLLNPSASTLPVEYTGYEHQAISSYFAREEAPSSVAQLVDQLRSEVDHQTVPFLTRLAETISTRCEMIVRSEGNPWPAGKTLEAEQGSCRDLVVLFIACCNRVGLPARFVSGYQYQLEDSEHALHAWAEVYLPGAGWRAFDPSLGLAVRDAHVPLAAAAHSTAAAPTTGRFRGANVRSRLKSELLLRSL